MNEISVGMAVTPVNGRYEGRLMAVVGVSGGYALVADGRRRRVERPKRKKLCHLSPLPSDENLLEVNAGLTNGDVRRYLAKYRSAIPDKNAIQT